MLKDNLSQEELQGKQEMEEKRGRELPVRTWKRRARGAGGSEVEGIKKGKIGRKNTKRKIIPVEVDGVGTDYAKKARLGAKGEESIPQILAEARSQPRQAP